MTETGLEKVVASTNGGAEARVTEPKATVLARDDSLSGRMEVKGSGQVLGTFKGQIDCDGDLLIGPDAHVEADIRTSRMTVSGFIRGNVVALGRLKITNTGRLEGDAKVGALVVEEGGVHHGVIRVHPEGVPDSGDELIADPEARATPSNLKVIPNSVGRVRKLWGEFF